MLKTSVWINGVDMSAHVTHVSVGGPWTVSYRKRRWGRRYYALMTYDENEAAWCEAQLRKLGYRRLRVDTEGQKDVRESVLTR
jgi:hypothetical protein